MKVTRDKKMDVAYVQFRKGAAAKTVKLRDDLLMDLNRKGQILGIEVLSLSETAPELKPVKKAKRSKAPTRKRAKKLDSAA